MVKKCGELWDVDQVECVKSPWFSTDQNTTDDRGNTKLFFDPYFKSKDNSPVVSKT